jgi:hypothetical protein
MFQVNLVQENNCTTPAASSARDVITKLIAPRNPSNLRSFSFSFFSQEISLVTNQGLCRLSELRSYINENGFRFHPCDEFRLQLSVESICSVFSLHIPPPSEVFTFLFSRC